LWTIFIIELNIIYLPLLYKLERDLGVGTLSLVSWGVKPSTDCTPVYLLIIIYSILISKKAFSGFNKITKRTEVNRYSW